MGSLKNANCSMPWRSFYGFNFVVTGQAAGITNEVIEALLSTKHIGMHKDSTTDANRHKPELVIMLNICVLFHTLVYFQPYMARPDFWETISIKWGLLTDYRKTRFLVHIWTSARKTFLADRALIGSGAWSRDMVAYLSLNLAGDVDNWQMVYTTYFELRDRAYGKPDNDLKKRFESAKIKWNTDISLYMRQLLEKASSVQRQNHCPIVTEAALARANAVANQVSHIREV